MPQMQDLPILGSMTLADSGKLLFAGSSKVEDATADKNAKNSKNGAGGAAVVVTAESVMETAQAKIDDRLTRLTDAYIDGMIGKDVFGERRSHLLLDQARLNEAIGAAPADGRDVGKRRQHR